MAGEIETLDDLEARIETALRIRTEHDDLLSLVRGIGQAWEDGTLDLPVYYVERIRAALAKAAT